MSTGIVRDFGRDCWTEVMNRVIGACVFLDEPSAESLHWHGGLLALLDSGAVAVKSLSPFELAKPEYKKGLFISECTSTQLSTIREIIRHSSFTHAILVATASLDVLYAELNPDLDISEALAAGRAQLNASKQLEKMLLEWIDRQQSAVEVVHIPIFTISLTGLTFVMPPFGRLHPSFSGRLVPGAGGAELHTLAPAERAAVRRLGGCLNSMLESLSVREDVFYVGPFSAILAGVLEYSPVCIARRKKCLRPASLIIVDRTLDLCSVTSHGSECLLDKIMTLLPRFPGHSTDVAIDMSPLCEANVVSVTEDIQLSPGCLYHAGEESCVQTFEHLINKTQKEVLFHLHNRLSSLNVPRSPSHSALRITPQSVEKIVTAAKGKYEMIESHLGLLQQALGVVQTLKSVQHSQLELMQSLEKQALQNIATSRDSTSVLNQISHLIKSRAERGLPLERLLALAVHVYSLAGTEVAFSAAHEEALAAALSRALFEEHRTLLPDADSRIVTPEHCEALAADVMQRLRDVGQARRILSKYNSVLKPSDTGSTVEYKGLLQQLVEDLVDPERPELVDLKHRNEGIKDLLRSGLNILISSGGKKPRASKHPLDSPLVVVLVVGGVTAEEARQLQRVAVASGTDARLLLGSTRLVPPLDAMRDALALR